MEASAPSNAAPFFVIATLTAVPLAGVPVEYATSGAAPAAHDVCEIDGAATQVFTAFAIVQLKVLTRLASPSSHV